MKVWMQVIFINELGSLNVSIAITSFTSKKGNVSIIVKKIFLVCVENNVCK
jgi:hypothetical protein